MKYYSGGQRKDPSSVDSGVFGRDEWVPSAGGIVAQIGLVRSKCDESLLDWAQVDGVVLDIDASQAVVDGIQHGVNQVVAFLSANHRLVVLVAKSIVTQKLTGLTPALRLSRRDT